MMNLKGSDAMIAEQFLCIICDNMVIPKFKLGTEDVKKSSILIPQCEACDGLACYSCWRDHVRKDNTSCPSCMAPIERRTGSVRAMSERPSTRVKTHGAESSATEYLDNDPWEAEFDRSTVFCKQKLLLNILFEQKIKHECQFLH